MWKTQVGQSQWPSTQGDTSRIHQPRLILPGYELKHDVIDDECDLVIVNGVLAGRPAVVLAAAGGGGGVVVVVVAAAAAVVVVVVVE